MRTLASWLDTALHDVRYGARLLRRSPWFTIVGIATLAIGLGSSVALFTVLNGVLFRPLPGHDTADIHQIHTSNSGGGLYGGTSFADFQSYTSAAPDLFTAACATTLFRANLVVDGVQQALSGAVGNGGCFTTLGVRAHAGRLLSASDDNPAAAPAPIVIGYGLWQRAFGGDPAIVGREGQLNGAPIVIVGVAERGFAGVSLDGGAEVWTAAPLVPILIEPAVLTDRGYRMFRVYVRLADGTTTAQAASRLAVVAAQLRAEDPRAWTDRRGSTRTITIARELDSRFAGGAPGAREATAAMGLGVVAFIVILTCVNLATMTVARGAARAHELNVRLALGASRRRLLRQLGTESLLISVAGLLGGVAVIAVALRLYDLYRPAEISAVNLALDWRVALFSMVMTVAAPVLFGVTPGAHALRLAIAEGLKGRPLIVRRGRWRIGSRELLLAVQVTMSFALLIMATLFMRALMEGGPADERATTDGIAVVPIDLNTAARDDAGVHVLAERLLQAAARVSGVADVTAAAIVPMTGSNFGVFGRAADRADAEDIVIDANIVAPGYFDLTGVAVRAGRSFDVRDHERAPLVAVVSESLARQLWGTAAAVGRSVRIDDKLREVVGVVADVTYRPENGTVQPVIYMPLAQAERVRFIVHARVQNEGESIAALDRALREVDGRVIVGPAMSLTQLHDQVKIGGKAAQWIGGAAGLLQLGLALMATWGLVAYAVTRRTAEIAIRRALGANETSILHLVMRPSLVLLAIGAVAGCVVGVAGAMTLHSTFLGLAPLDLTVVIPALVLLAPVVAAAAWWPARRAVAIEPAVALKEH